MTRWARGPRGLPRGRVVVLALVIVIVIGLLAMVLWPERARPGTGADIAPAPPPAQRTTASPRALGSRLKPVVSPVQVAIPATLVDSRRDGATFSGHVRSTIDRRGIGGAELVFTHEGQAHVTRTDGRGQFRFAVPRIGQWSLALITAHGHLPFSPAFGHAALVLEATAGREVSGLELLLTPAVKRRVRVLSPAGEPVAGASVRLLEHPEVWPFPSALETPASGEVQLELPEDALVEATHPLFGSARKRFELPAQLQDLLVLRFEAGGVPAPDAADGPPRVRRLSGRVVTKVRDGVLGLPGARVSATRVPRDRFAHDDGLLSPVPDTVTDLEGAFVLQGLMPSQYRVTAEADDHAPVTVVISEETATVELVLSAGGRLRGAVLAPDGAPVESFFLVLARATSALERAPLRTQTMIDPSGRFLVEHLPAGRMALVGGAAGYGPSAEVLFEVREGETIERDVRLTAAGRLIGVVTSRDSGAAIAGARLSLEGALSDETAVQIAAAVYSDARGEFTLAGLGVGPKSLAVRASGFHPRLVSGLEVRAGVTLGPIEVKLTPMKPEEEPRLELVGIGVVLAAEAELLRVGQVLAGGGAARAGLQAGDAVLAVDGVSVTELGFGAAIQRVRGEEGTVVRLTIKRGEASPSEVPVTRTRLETPAP